MRNFVGIAIDLLVGQDIFAVVGVAMQVTTQPSRIHMVVLSGRTFVTGFFFSDIAEIIFKAWEDFLLLFFCALRSSGA